MVHGLSQVEASLCSEGSGEGGSFGAQLDVEDMGEHLDPATGFPGIVVINVLGGCHSGPPCGGR